jgi:arylsulfate sulfotransferase
MVNRNATMTYFRITLVLLVLVCIGCRKIIGESFEDIGPRRDVDIKMDTETNSDTDANNRMDSLSVIDTTSDKASDFRTDRDSATETASDTGTERELGSDASIDTEGEIDSASSTTFDDDTESTSEIDTTSSTESDTQTDTIRSTESTSEIDTTCDTESDSKGDTDSETDRDSGVLMDSGVDSESETESESNPIPDTETDSDTMNSDPIPLSSVRVALDPYNAAPLTAVVIVDDARLIWEEILEIEVVIKGRGEGSADFIGVLNPHSASYWENFDVSDLLEEGEVGIPVLGLYADHNNIVEIDITTETHRFVSEVQIETKAIQSLSREEISIDLLNPGALEPGWLFLEDRVYDNQGNCRWKGPRIFRLNGNGNIMDIEGEWSWLGKPLRRFDLPDHLSTHHDVIEMPEGNLAICVDNSETTIVNRAGQRVVSIEDYIVEIDPADNIVNAWDLRAFFDVDRCVFAEKQNDWFHANTLCYDAFDDAMIVSGRAQGIISVTRGGIQGDEANRGKKLKWILAPHLDWGMSGPEGAGDVDPNAYLLTAVDENGIPFDEDVQNNVAPPFPDPDAFFWPIGQHGLVIASREAGRLNLLTFNNQASFIFGGPGTTNNGITFFMEGDLSDDRALESFSQIIEYEIDEEAMTVRKVWSFGEHRPELYGSFVSGVAQLKETGNRLLITNGMNMYRPQSNPVNPHVIEVSPSGDEVFHLEIENTNVLIFRAAGRVDLYHP